MKCAVIDCRMSNKCKKSLGALGYKLIEISENPYMDKPVSAHPDIFLFCYKDNIIVEKKNLTFLKQMFNANDCVRIIDAEWDFINNIRYPDDCCLNFAVCGKYLIGNMKHINPVLAEFAECNSMEYIHVNQGYSKCNICVINDHALITEDKGIAEACTSNGIDVLLLCSNYVKLNGYKYGFIGGASGRFVDEKGRSKILFCGCIEKHPEYQAIKSFCDKHGAEPVSLSDEQLYDYGSVILL